MKKNKSLFVLLALCFSAIWADAQVSLSFEESLRLLRQENQSLKIADKSIEIAKAERDKLNAFWYPSLQSAGAFVHMSEKIEVKQPLSQFTDPAKNFVHSIIPDDQVISAILDQIGANTLVFPLTPRNLTSIDLSAEWVLFSGGKRFHATNIGRTMVDLARENRAQTAATQQNLLTESYYGLRLAQQIVTVREETYKGLQKHYENALKLEAAGMIDKAGRLFAQVNMDEAKRTLDAARKDETVVQNTLKGLCRNPKTYVVNGQTVINCFATCLDVSNQIFVIVIEHFSLPWALTTGERLIQVHGQCIPKKKGRYFFRRALRNLCTSDEDRKKRLVALEIDLAELVSLVCFRRECFGDSDWLLSWCKKQVQ